MPEGDLRRLVPVLTGRPQDVRRQVAFWERLGFTVTGGHGEYEYVVLMSDDVEVHVSEWDEHDPYRTAGVVYLRVADVDVLYERLHAELEAEGLLYLAPATGITEVHTSELRAMDAAGTEYIRLHERRDQPWGQREFGVIDPAGWLVHVASPIPQ